MKRSRNRIMRDLGKGGARKLDPPHKPTRHYIDGDKRKGRKEREPSGQ